MIFWNRKLKTFIYIFNGESVVIELRRISVNEVIFVMDVNYETH